MKTLYILRHGEKDTSNPEQYDYDIELSPEGLEQSQLIAQKLKENKILPELIVSSPAIRTRQTTETIIPIIGYRKNVIYNEVIYQAFLNELIEVITYTYDNIDKLMIIGHNPSLSALGFALGGYKEKLDTAEFLQIDFNCSSWTMIDKSNAKFIQHLKP